MDLVAFAVQARPDASHLPSSLCLVFSSICSVGAYVRVRVQACVRVCVLLGLGALGVCAMDLQPPASSGDRRRFNVLVNVIRVVGIHPKIADATMCAVSGSA
jgi:hypothetical protein